MEVARFQSCEASQPLSGPKTAFVAIKVGVNLLSGVTLDLRVTLRFFWSSPLSDATFK